MVSKTSICKEVAEEKNVSEKVVTEVVNAYFAKLKEKVAAGESVTMVGFGTFKPAERAARDGRNPATGESIHIPASKTVKFKASDSFKNSL